jgi:septal ring factor EnvC (AmiA/AmiB activator)
MNDMKTSTFALALLCAFGLLTGCRSTHESDTAGLRREMRSQMNAARSELKASGATAQQLREFDRAMAELERTMGKLERQLHALEKQLDEK